MAGLPPAFCRYPFNTWVERDTVGEKFLAQEHNPMSPARTRTRSTRSGVEHSNHMGPPRLPLGLVLESRAPIVSVSKKISARSLSFVPGKLLNTTGLEKCLPRKYSNFSTMPSRKLQRKPQSCAKHIQWCETAGELQKLVILAIDNFAF